MATQQTQQPQVPNPGLPKINASDGTELDPTAAILTKAIRQQESSGDYNAVGDNGQSKGAYQFNKDNFSTWAKEFNLDPADMSPANQDKVAYYKIKQHLDSGRTQGEVAALWNGAHIENGKYVANNPDYPKKIEANYNQFAQQPAQPTIQPTVQPQETASSDSPDSNTGWDYIKNLMPKNLTEAGMLVGAAGLKAGQYVAQNAAALAPLAVGTGVTALTKSPIAGAAAGMLTADFEKNTKLIPSETTATTEETPLPQTVGPTLQELMANNMTEANKNTEALYKSQSQAYQGTPTGSVKAQKPETQAGLRTNSMFGFAPEINPDGRQNYSRALQKSQQTEAELHGTLIKALDAEGSKGNLSSMVKTAQEMAKQRPAYEQEDLLKNINQIATSYGKDGDELPLSGFQKIKQDTSEGSKGRSKKWNLFDTPTKTAAFRMISLAARQEIEKNTKSPELYNAAMKLEQNLIKGREIMHDLNGKKAPAYESNKKEFMKVIGNVAGSWIGHKIGGTTGALIGYLIENNISNAVDKKFGRTIFETPGVRHAMQELKQHTPEAYKAVVAELKSHGIEAEALMKQKQNDPLHETVNEVLAKHKEFKLPDLLEEKLKSSINIPKEVNGSKNKKPTKSDNRYQKNGKYRYENA